MDSTPTAEFGPLSIIPASPSRYRLGAWMLGFGAADEATLEPWLADEGCDLIRGPGKLVLGQPRALDIVLLAAHSAEELAGLLDEARTWCPDAFLIALTPEGEPEAVLTAMRSGVHDCLVRPVSAARLKAVLERARERIRLRLSCERSGDKELSRLLPARMGGVSRAISELRFHVARVTDRDVAVFLEGEAGSGVELVARAIHRSSSRAGGPFWTFDCSAVDAAEHEMHLVGRELSSGRFVTGAIEQATGGVLYIEHIERLSSNAQAALSGYLSTRQIRRLEGGVPLLLSTRVVASGDSDLRNLVADGLFREDLFFRLVVYPIRVPPLRERLEDVPLIAAILLDELRQEMGGDAPSAIQSDAIEILLRYPWPGNVRELENVMQRSMLSARGSRIEREDLPVEVRLGVGGTAPANHNSGEPLFLDEIVPLREIERRAIEHALRLTDGNVAVAAKKLGIGRATLYRRIASLEVSVRVA
jgi:DNA-binding NtrC family response regulator